MHFTKTALVALAAYASSAAARPQVGQFKRQVANTSSTDITSSASMTDVSTSVPVSTTSQVSSSASSSSTGASVTGQTVAVPGGKYTAVGCYLDPANTGYPLVGAIKVSTSASTDQCLTTCASTGVGGPFTYAAVEGGDCFCSNSLDTSAAQSPGSCAAAKKRDIFGRQAANAITVYQFTPTTSTALTTSGTSVGSVTVTVSASSTDATTGTASTTSTSTSASATPTFPSTPYYIVVSGDTLASLAQQYGISLAALEALNRQLADPNNIFPGEVINLPNNPSAPVQNGFTAEYTVKSGDTLNEIADAFGLSLSDLIAANPQISDPDSIFPGQEINIPSSRVFTYSVASGNTLYAISQAFGISLDSLIAANPQITNPNLIFPGQVINIPV